MPLELRGFSADRGRFLLTTARSDAPHVPPRVLERDLVDLQSWDRLLRRSSPGLPRLPTKRLRRLMVDNWVRGDRAAGWRLELQKNVSACEGWLNAAFVQLPAQLQQEFLDDELYATAKHKRVAARADSKQARDLQQYFTSAELVDLVLKRVFKLLQLKDKSDVVWLEPSCGGGRFLTALLRAGGRHVVGYEIDERWHGIATENVRHAADDARWEVHSGDFLASKSSIPTDKFVVAVGNPPFGAKGDDGSDLVHHFVRHAAREWHARVVAFIVPERCTRPAFIETTLHQLQQHDAALSWELKTELPLIDHHFEFGAGDKLKRVRQPIFLQIFSR
ncbi:hypothetical protein PRNP1_000440 [Phytophthora ramorum]